MIFEQFHLPGLGHASYLLGCERSGQALVFDPRRDVDCYLAAARRHGLRVGYVMDFHGHNDYLSGLTELVARTGAELLAPVDGPGGLPAPAAGRRGTRRTRDLAVQAFATPEHTSLLAYDRSVSADEPALLLSGGALLVGDLARPGPAGRARPGGGVRPGLLRHQPDQLLCCGLLSRRVRPLLRGHVVQCRSHHGTFPADIASASGRKHRSIHSPSATRTTVKGNG